MPKDIPRQVTDLALDTVQVVDDRARAGATSSACMRSLAASQPAATRWLLFFFFALLSPACLLGPAGMQNAQKAGRADGEKLHAAVRSNDEKLVSSCLASDMCNIEYRTQKDAVDFTHSCIA